MIGKRSQLWCVWAGPLAVALHLWNGLIGFYIPIAMFTIWIAVTTYLLLTGISRQFAEVGAEPAAGARSGPSSAAFTPGRPKLRANQGATTP